MVSTSDTETNDKNGAEYVEKRLKPTLIRRRAKPAGESEQKPVKQELSEATVEKGEVTSPDVEEKQKTDVDTPPTAVKLAGEGIVEGAKEVKAEAFKDEKTEPVARSLMAKVSETSGPLGTTKLMPGILPRPTMSKEEREKQIKSAKKKKSRAEWEAEDIRRAGGYLKFVDEIVTTDSEEEPPAVVKESIERMDRVFKPAMAKKKRGHRREFHQTVRTEAKAIKKIIRIEETITIAELSQRMGVKSGEILKKLIDLGIMATINRGVDVDTATVIAQEYGFEVEHTALKEESVFTDQVTRAGVGQLARAPVVTVMGHVDHGKTSLLDAIRKTDVASSESGGITQHIGASVVSHDKGTITFIDTPGHEAFTAMRSRGSKVTDIVILVVAADDGIMPQTKEAISHAKAANVPIIVDINKIDKPEANIDRIKRELSENSLLPEDWGGDIICVETSAKSGKGIDKLLEMILLQAEIMELKADPAIAAEGIVLEAKLDRGRGPVATVLVQRGTLKLGMPIVCGLFCGKTRALFNSKGEAISEAGPSTPVEILGLDGVPEAGDALNEASSDKMAKEVSDLRQRKYREIELSKTSKVTLEDLHRQISEGEVRTLNLIIKADAQGSSEALADSFKQITHDKVKVEILHKGIGGITENDVMLASASNAIIIGFNVVADVTAQKMAEAEGVEICRFSIIYEAIDEVKKAMSGLLEPTRIEKVTGRAQVRDVFKITRVGTVAGCYVTSGKIIRSAKARLLRDNVIVYEGDIHSLKRFKDDVREVENSQECGISFESFHDIKSGDEIEAYLVEEKRESI